jgi:hypothetical protein
VEDYIKKIRRGREYLVEDYIKKITRNVFHRNWFIEFFKN